MTYRFPSSLLLALVLGWPALAGAFEFPHNIELEYRVERSGIKVGSLERSISQLDALSGREYRVDSVARPEGMARLLFRGETREVARFQYQDGQVRPLHYLYRQRTGDKRDVELTFHWAERRVRERHSGDEWELEDDTQDLVSAQFSIMQRLARGERTFRFTLATDDGLEEFRYQLVGRMPVSTPAGDFVALKVKEMRSDPDKRHKIFWFAPRLDYLPVHIEERRNGRRTMVLSLSKAP